MYRLVALCLLFVASLGCGSANKPTANTNGSAVDELLAQGNDLRTTDPDAAIEKYRQAGELNGGSPQALNNLALLSAETGRHDDAIAALQRLDVIAPAQSEKTRSLIREWSLSFLGGAHIQLDMGELQSAQENYELYIKYNPESDEGFTGRGNVLMAQGNLDEAEEAFKTALRLNPKSGMALVGRGNLRIQQKDWEAAIESLSDALEIFPDHYPAYEARAEAYDGQGSPTLAAKDRDRAKSIRNKQSDQNDAGEL